MEKYIYEITSQELDYDRGCIHNENIFLSHKIIY